MSKDSEKHSAQGFAARNADCRAEKFQTQGFGPGEPLNPSVAAKYRRANREMFERQFPTPVRSGK